MKPGDGTPTSPPEQTPISNRPTFHVEENAGVALPHPLPKNAYCYIYNTQREHSESVSHHPLLIRQSFPSAKSHLQHPRVAGGISDDKPPSSEGERRERGGDLQARHDTQRPAIHHAAITVCRETETVKTHKKQNVKIKNKIKKMSRVGRAVTSSRQDQIPDTVLRNAASRTSTQAWLS